MRDYDLEMALVNRLILHLEESLGGRNCKELLDRPPGDYFHLGVLVPQPDGQYSSESINASEKDDEEAESSTFRGGQITQVRSARRPVSTIGCEFAVKPDDSGCVELSIRSSFAIYPRYFPKHDQQRTELGTGARGGTTVSQHGIPIRERYKRIDVPMNAYPLTLQLPQEGSVAVIVLPSKEEPFQEALDAISKAYLSDPMAYRRLSSQRQVIPPSALQTEPLYEKYLASAATEKPSFPFRASYDVRAYKKDNGEWRISVFLTNRTTENDGTSSSSTAIQRSLRSLVDVRIQVEIRTGDVHPIELVGGAADYQVDRNVWAVGHACTATFAPATATVSTDCLGRFKQPRLTTMESTHAEFDVLATEPIHHLEAFAAEMDRFVADWNDYINCLDSSEAHACRTDRAAFLAEVARFREGVQALRTNPQLLRAFQSMHKAMIRAGARKSPPIVRWRLFQIGFIVTQLPALAAREGFNTDTLLRLDTLWFPTGGGKTEAYLGLIVCAALFDRLRGKSIGVTAWLRFPLRMLSVQQLQRASVILYEAEIERQTLTRQGYEMGEAISLAFLVGGGQTPNALSSEEIEKWLVDPDKLVLVPQCPRCGKHSVKLVGDKAVVRLYLRCQEQDCRHLLQVYVSDDEVYRFLPTVLVGTIDKIASIAWQKKFARLYGYVTHRCPVPEHGFTHGDYCSVFSCKKKTKSMPRVEPYDPVPALQVQDELHLLREELGTFSGHYETLLRFISGARSNGKPTKLLAATATIEGLQHQSQNLYGVPAVRFPVRGFRSGESFYSRWKMDPAGARPEYARYYIGAMSPRLHEPNMAHRCLEILHQEVRRLRNDIYALRSILGDTASQMSDENLRELLDFYDVSLTYVQSKEHGERIRGDLDRRTKQALPKAGQRDLETVVLTGNSTMAEISRTVKEIEEPREWNNLERVDAVIATSVISHGVDVERFNVMVLAGIPGRTAEYIQASSRAGRQHLGLVVVAFSPWKNRDASLFHRFQEYHKHIERLVEPVPINRFAKFSVRRTAPGILAGALLSLFAPAVGGSEGGMMDKPQIVRNLLDGLPDGRRIREQEVLEAMRSAYAIGLGIFDPSLEAAMDELVREEYRRQMAFLQRAKSDRLANELNPQPMTSLRDVDRQVPFEPAPGHASMLDVLRRRTRAEGG